jgi:hypothetical protein
VRKARAQARASRRLQNPACKISSIYHLSWAWVLSFRSPLAQHSGACDRMRPRSARGGRRHSAAALTAPGRRWCLAAASRGSRSVPRASAFWLASRRCRAPGRASVRRAWSTSACRPDGGARRCSGGALPPAGPGPSKECHVPTHLSHGLECSVLPTLPAPWNLVPGRGCCAGRQAAWADLGRGLARSNVFTTSVNLLGT